MGYFPEYICSALTEGLKIKEVLGSRDGSSTGVGGSRERVIFRVLASAAQCTPFGNDRLAPDPRALVQTYVCPWGTVAPWDRTAYTSTYTVLEQKAPLHWRVAVDFARPGPDNPPASYTGRWLISARGVSISKTIIEEVPRTDNPASQGRVIGPVQFAQQPEATGARYWYYDVAEDGTSSNAVSLFPIFNYTGDYDRVPVEQPSEVQAIAATFTRVQPNFQLGSMVPIAGFRKCVNSTWFEDAEPGHVLFEDFTIDPIELDFGGNIQIERGRAWRVSLVFIFAFERWDLLPLVSTYIDPEGREHIVYGDRGKFTETFAVKPLKDLNAIAQILNSYNRGSRLSTAPPPIGIIG